METVSKNSRPAKAFVFSAELTIDKLKRMSVLLFPALVYLTFIAFLSLFFSFSWLRWRLLFRSCEIKVHMGDETQIIDTVFINPFIISLS